MPAATTLFRSNRSQAVRLPKEVAFPEGVTKVLLRKVGNSVVITPAEALWDDFFQEAGDLSFPEREQPPAADQRQAF